MSPSLRLHALIPTLVLAAILAACAPGPSAVVPEHNGAAYVVSVRMPSSLSAEPRSGISVGNGYVATAAPWLDYPSFCCAKEAPSEAKFEIAAPGTLFVEADLHGLDAGRGLMLFRLAGLSSPAVAPSGRLSQGARAWLVGVEPAADGGGALAPGGEVPAAVLGTSVELEGTLGRFALLEPDRTWSGLAGALVLDSARRPVAMVRHFVPAGEGTGARAYAVSLADVQAWALR